jgi:P4 family phage/plasmid primase-like protien
LIDAAKSLIELGMPIIPICPHDHQYMSTNHINRCKCAGKTPLIKGWQTHYETTEELLNEWTKSFKKFNLGLPLGEISGYCGIDVDGDEGVRLLLEMSNGDLPGTWEFSTGAGSRLLYTIPAGIKTKKFTQKGDGAHQECALLCSGQQTVVPPSIHHTGKRYEWIEGHSPWDMDCAVAPEWLIKLIKFEEPQWEGMSMPVPSGSDDLIMNIDDEFIPSELNTDMPPAVTINNRTVKTQTGKTGHKIVVTDELLSSRISEGARDDTMTAIAGHYCANRDLRRFGKQFIIDVCLKHNRDFCDPPLEDQVIRDKVEYFFTAEGMKDAQFKAARGKSEKIIFEASRMAEEVLKYFERKGLHIHFDQFSRIYYYTTSDKGPWHSTRNYAIIQKWIREVIASNEYGDASWDKRSYIEEVRMAFEELFTVPYKRVDDFDLGAHADDLCDYIVVANGMVDWKNRLLVDWDPTYKTTIAFDVEYDPDATCPHFEQYMEDWLPDEQVRTVVQEYLGYCLIPNTNFRKALFLYGKGKNGKSVLLEFLQDFFGDHASALSYDGLFTRFGPATLKDKLVNIFDDTTVSFTKETGVVKNLIAGGTIQAEHKGAQIFQFTNTARLIFSSQETPRTSDNSVAWYDRWFFVHFPNQFRPSNKVKMEMQRNLKEERAGIFNWMIEGLARLIEQDDFSECARLQQTSRDYRSQNDNVAQFVLNMCMDVPEKGEPTSLIDLYKVYNIWVEGEQLRPVSKKVFSMRIADMGYIREKGYASGKAGQTYFKNLQLNKNAEEYLEYALEIRLALEQR